MDDLYRDGHRSAARSREELHSFHRILVARRTPPTDLRGDMPLGVRVRMAHQRRGFLQRCTTAANAEPYHGQPKALNLPRQDSGTGLGFLAARGAQEIAFAVVVALSGEALRGGWTFPLRFSLPCLGFSFLFRGVQRGYFSFQSERSEIMKVGEWLISAKELPWQKMISLCRSRLDE